MLHRNNIGLVSVIASARQGAVPGVIAVTRSACAACLGNRMRIATETGKRLWLGMLGIALVLAGAGVQQVLLHG